MALISISGEPGCGLPELARMLGNRLQWDLVDEARLGEMIASQFPRRSQIPDKAWPHLASAVLAKLGAERHLIVLGVGSELLLRDLPGRLRLHVTAPEQSRVGNIMLEYGVDRKEARRRLREMEKERNQLRKCRFGQRTGRPSDFDLVLNAEAFSPEDMAGVLEAVVQSRHLAEANPLPPSAEAEVQFKIRLRLARFGIAPEDRARPHREFGHPSEEVFANLLDFYRIAWDYEPRSFPLQWDKDGKVLEAFTPDFYLPEFDLYVELTTMKQANVTRKNRKIRLLRGIYPHVNIQVFYQKDVQDLVMKYGLPERLAQ